MTLQNLSDGNIRVTEDGRIALDTSVPMMNLVPDSSIILTDYNITWPDFWTGTIYHQTRDTFSGIGVDVFGCSTWVGIVAQEWGPTRPSPFNLAEITLGTVPVGTTYLEVMIRLTRTVDPAKVFDVTLAPAIIQNAWMKLEGQSCLVEFAQGVVRSFDIVIDGTTVKLRRFQSAGSLGNTFPPAYRVNGGAVAGNAQFFYAGTNAPENTDMVLYGEKIDEKRDTSAPTHRPAGKEAGSSNNVPCSMSHAGISYTSTWNGEIRIKPGRITT